MRGSRDFIPRLPSRAWLILGGDALSALGSGLTLPFFIVYLARVRGIDLGAAGLILSAIAVAGLLGNPVGGGLADRIGARRAVIVGLLLAAVGTAGMVLVHQAWQGFVVAALYGLGMSVLWPAQDALLATAVNAGQRPQVFALRHATLNIGFSLGALAAALVVASLPSPTGFALLYLLDAVSFLVFAALLTRISDVAIPDHPDIGSTEESSGYREVLRDRVFIRVWLLVLLLVTAGYAQFHAAFPAFATGEGGMNAWELSLAFAANTITVVFAQLIVLRLLAGHRRTRGVMLSAAFIAAAWVATLIAARAGSSAVALFVLAMVLFGLGETLFSPTVPAIVNDLAPDRIRGRYNGVYTLAWTTGSIAGPAMAGFVLAAEHGYVLFMSFIGGMCVAAVGAWRLERHLPPTMNRISQNDAPASASPDQDTQRPV